MKQFVLLVILAFLLAYCHECLVTKSTEYINLKELKTQMKSSRNSVALFINEKDCDNRCKDMVNTWTDAKESELKRNHKFFTVSISKKEESSVVRLAKALGNPSFPLVAEFVSGKEARVYDRLPTSKSFEYWIKNPTLPTPWWEEDNSVVHLSCVKDVKELKEFTKSGDKNRALVMFYAPWCGHCKNFKPIFSTLAAERLDSYLKEGHGWKLAAVDCVEHPDICKEDGLSITGYPTIKVVDGGEFTINYSKKRTLEDMRRFLASSTVDES